MEEDGVEVTMYGEVVETHPKHWWTGEPLDGLYIVLDEFLDTLDGLKGRKVTVHINSVGGDANAGIAIHNRLAELEDVTTVCDSLAASAASVIFMAGGERLMYAGSQLMIHNTSVLLWDYYQSKDLAEAKAMLDSYDKTIAGIYARKADGATEQQIRNLMSKTSYLSPEDAVGYGLATGVVEDAEADLKAAAGGGYVVCNGVWMPALGLGQLPPGIPEEQMEPIGAPSAAQSAGDRKGGDHMTLEELKEQHPELVAQITAEAQAAGLEKEVSEAVAAERQRIRDIESIEPGIQDAELIREAKYGEKPMDAKELAFAAMQKQAQLGQSVLAAMQRDAAASGANAVNPVAPPEDSPMTEAEAQAAYDDFYAKACGKEGK